jgi:hypothetical protein
MGIQKVDGRQSELVVTIPFTFADFDASGVAEIVTELPGVAQDVKGNLAITTPFNSATSDVIAVGDDAADDTYVAAQDGQVAADADFDVSIPVLGVNTNVKLKWTGVGAAPTAGAGRLRLTYTQQNRVTETID